MKKTISETNKSSYAIKDTHYFFNTQDSTEKIGDIPFKNIIAASIGDDSICVSDVFDTETGLIAYAHSSSQSATCPYCGHTSQRCHSEYLRKIKHMPVCGKPMQLLFRARKFFCDNSECSKKTFAEQPGTEIFRYQRLTRAAEVSLCRTGVGCTSRLASELIRSQGIAASGSTVLRHIHNATMPLSGHYRNIGVDDWAYRKGVNYGAVVVDLDARIPVAILENRKQESFCGWLKDHPEVECISRDRASEFSSAVRKQGREVREVADRFHLLMNVQAMFQEISDSQYAKSLSAINAALNRGCAIEDTTSPRAIKFKMVKDMQKSGATAAAIHRKTGVSLSAIDRYFRMDKIYKVVRSTKYDYEKYRTEVESGIANGLILKEVWNTLKESGAKIGTLRAFQEYFSYLSKGRGATANGKKRIKPVSKKEVTRVAFLSINKAECMTETQKGILDALKTQNWYLSLFETVSEFVSIVKNGTPKLIEEWIKKNQDSKWTELSRFCRGIKRDIAAVKMALAYRKISQGVVEGIVNKIKAFRRSMYGRCSNDLLLLKMVLSKCYFN